MSARQLSVPEKHQLRIARHTLKLTDIGAIKPIRNQTMKHNETKCPNCNGSGLDKAHIWPDGSFASCERCEGYGTINEPNERDLPESAREAIAAICREYAVRNVLDYVATVLHEMAEENGFEPDETVLRDDAAIVAHAASHIRS